METPNDFRAKRGETQEVILRLPKFYFFEWQELLIGQSAHPHPQEDFPFFLLRIIFAIIAETTASKTVQIMMVAIFSESHASIVFPPVQRYYFVTLTGFVSFVASLYGLKSI